jgi:hypothetical protein
MLDPGMPPREAGWKRSRMGDLVVVGVRLDYWITPA